MSRSTFVRTRHDARSVVAAHRFHQDAPRFGCPLCVARSRRDGGPRWNAPRR
jgi:hypothetical protein